MSYRATITAETSEFQSGLMDLRMGLSKVNWLMRVLGLPPEQRKAFVEMQRMIRTLHTLRMILAGTSITGGLMAGLRMAGLGSYGSAVRNFKFAYQWGTAK